MTSDGLVSLAQANAEWLARLEVRLQAITTAENPFLTEAAQHVLAAGGKRLRPLLVVMASRLGSSQIDEEVLDAAGLAVELTHVASLHHDDVMDEAAMRRGVTSVNLRFGNSVAILTGDYLFARASTLVSTLGSEYILRQAETFRRMVEGQIAEFQGPTAGSDPMEHYLDVLVDKTASLIASSVVFGGMVAGLGQDELAALDRYGEALGLAFQLHDDLLDIYSDSAGKSAGTDLRAGLATLPLLLLAQSDDLADQRLAESLRSDSSEAAVAEALAVLRAHPVLEQAATVVANYASQAKDELSDFPDSPARAGLMAIVDEMTSQERAI